MKKYMEIAKVFFKIQLAWRVDVFFNMLFTITKILFAYILWKAIFGENVIVAGFTFDMMLSYYVFSGFLSQIEVSSNVSNEISTSIRNGTFSKYLVIPVYIQKYFFSQTLGIVGFYLSFDLLASILWIFLFRIKLVFTTNILMILVAILLVILGIVFMVQLNYFIGILTLKFEDIKTFLMIKDNLIQFVSGSLVPLALLPKSILGIMEVFPFYYITYLPSMILIGKNQDEVFTGIIVLCGWILFMYIINKVTFKSLRTKYDGVGI